MDRRQVSLIAIAIAAAGAAPAWAQSKEAPSNAAQPGGPQARGTQARGGDRAAETQPEIVVTGSALPVSPGAVAVPVSVVSSAKIAQTGVDTNVLEILRKAIPAFGGRNSVGSSSSSNTTGGTAGGASIQIRNLDTLVLVNGRRVAVDSIAGVNGKVFVNVAEIPPAAIERIEVLTDGASAIYGSEAIGGVVNIILKSDYHGASVNVRYGGATDYSERSVNLTLGANPLPRTNLTFAGSYSASSPLYQYQRPFARPFYSTATAVPGAIGNFYLAPGLTAPTPGLAATIAADPQYRNAGATIATAPGSGIGGTYDLSPYQTLLLRQDQKAAALTLHSDLTGTRSIELFGDFTYTDNHSAARYAPVTATVTAPAGSAFNPLTTAATVVFGDTARPKTVDNAYRAWRGTIGLRGRLDFISPTWNWEIGYVHSENRIRQDIGNVVFTPNLARAVAGGFNSAGAAAAGGAFSNVLATTSPTGALTIQPALNPFAIGVAMNADALRNLLVGQTLRGQSRLDTADAKIAGTIGHLPGGAPGFALGASWRREAVSGAPADPNAWSHVGGALVIGATGNQPGASQNLFTGGIVADPFAASRTITAQFAELRVPITGAEWNLPGFYNFDVIGAIRHERYSDFGDSTVPKIGFRWQPIPRQIVIRGNYARSFTAPSLYQFNGPLNVATSGAAVITSAFPNAIPGIATQQSGSNGSLQPARSRSFSLGAVFKPDFVKHLSLDVDFSAVKETGQIAGIGLSNILFDVNANGAASPFYRNAATGALPGQAGASYFAQPGALLAYLSNPANLSGGVYPNLYLKDVPTNLGVLDVRSLNLGLDYWVPVGHGRLSLSSQIAILLSYRYQAIPGQPTYQYAGTTTQGGNALGTLPRLRTYSALDWDSGHWTAGVAHSFISAVDDIGTGGVGYFTNLAATPVAYAPGHVRAYQSWDLRLGYHVAEQAGGRGPTVTVGVNNLFDRMPSVSSNIDPAGGHATGATAWRADNNADLSTYGAIGRLVYVSAGYRF